MRKRKSPQPIMFTEAESQALELGRTIYMNMSARPECIFILHVVNGSIRMELCTTESILVRAQAARQDIATQRLRDIAPPPTITEA